MLEVINLKCNMTENHIGIVNPIFSWQLSSDDRNVMQNWFQIQLAIDSRFENVVWNHYAYSNASIDLEYFGPDLLSSTRYYVRVRVKSESNKSSNWSKSIYFETPLLNKNDWHAAWIAPACQEKVFEEKYRHPFIAEHSFSLSRKIAKARLYISALGLYDAQINDKKVGDDYLRPGFTDYANGVQYQTYDVTSLLKKQNYIKVLIGEGWYSGQLINERDNWGEKNALIAMLKIYYEDGSEEVVGTNENWKMWYSQIQYSSIYHGEYLDENFPENNSIKTVELQYPTSVLVPQEGPSVQEQRTISAVDLFTDSNGNLVLDFGENVSGWVRFRNTTHAKKIVMFHGEVLDADGNFYNANLRSAEARDTYIFNSNHIDDQLVYQPHFTFHGFRYVKLEGIDSTVSKNDFTAVVITSKNEKTGYFETDNQLINQLQENIQRSEDDNFVDIPSDCPQRDERMGWTADLQVFLKTASFNRNIDRFLWKWLRDLRIEQSQYNGAVPSIVPDVMHGEWIRGFAEAAAAWGDAATIVPWQLYQVFGDTKILEAQYESMKSWVDFIRSQGKTEALWDTGFQYGDWVALDAAEGSYFGATDSYLCSTAFFAYSTQIVANTAKLLRKMSDYREYTDLYGRIKKAYQEKFLPDGIKPITNTQTGNVLSLIFGLTKSENKQAMADNLVSLIKANGMHMDTGFLGTPYLCEVLSRFGYRDVAYDLLFADDFPSWLYQIKRGATTTWEHWDNIKPDGTFWSTDMNSFNHYAYGSIGQWMYEHIGGIINKAPGYQKSLIMPQLDNKRRITHAKCSLNTMYGKLSSEWNIEDNQLRLKVIIPCNTTSYVVLPQVFNKDMLKQQVDIITNGTAVYSDGSPQYRMVSFMGSPDFAVTTKAGEEIPVTVAKSDFGFQLGSGKYEFIYDIESQN